MVQLSCFLKLTLVALSNFSFQELPLAGLQKDILEGKTTFGSHDKIFPISDIAPDLTVYNFHDNSYKYEQLNVSKVPFFPAF